MTSFMCFSIPKQMPWLLIFLCFLKRNYFDCSFVCSFIHSFVEFWFWYYQQLPEKVIFAHPPFFMQHCIKTTPGRWRATCPWGNVPLIGSQGPNTVFCLCWAVLASNGKEMLASEVGWRVEGRRRNVLKDKQH